MKKLKLNKKVVSALDKSEMQGIEGGGICIATCRRGSDRGKSCCDSGSVYIGGGDNPCYPSPDPGEPVLTQNYS